MKRFEVLCYRALSERSVADAIEAIGIDIISAKEVDSPYRCKGWLFECEGTKGQYKKASKIFKEVEFNGRKVLAKKG